jgi:beta-1,4-mannosyl-glycoprotein beta-1,4-N-acetylglucosaminyltransferase
MKIIDAFTFFNEIDTLKIRFSLLYEKVDTFVICESNVTHSGHPKKYNFLEHKNEFIPWMDKITFLQYEPDISQLDISKNDSECNPSSASWQIEIGQRNFLSSVLVTQNPADIAIISDVDEIWNPSFSDFIRSGKIRHEAARLEMQLHYYHLNCVGIGRGNSKWTHPYFAKIDYINSNKNLSKIRTEALLPEIGNAGWHFSYLGGAEKVSDKISAFAHQETNTAEINNLIHLKRCINLGIDHLNRPDHEWAFRPIDYYPEALRNEMKKYPHLIKSSLI